MPAPPSSLIDPAIGHLVELAGDATEKQPGLLRVLAQVADPRHRRGVRHRLTVILGLALCAVAAGARSFTSIVAFPHAAQAIQITCRKRPGKKRWSTETVYAITSLAATQASPAELAAIIRSHWMIEDRLHWVRDLDYDEDHSPGPHRQRPTGHGHLAQPRYHGPAAGRIRQHCRRASPPRPPARPATTNDHEVLERAW